MSKTLLYYGAEFENTPVFNSNIKLDRWLYILEHVKQNGVFLYNSKKIYYYKLNNIDIIETLENDKNMYNLSEFKLDIVDTIYLKLQYNETVVDYITPEYDYYNKQIHKLQLFTLDNLRICFDEYVEDGNVYYNIYLIVNDNDNMNKFIDIINNINDKDPSL